MNRITADHGWGLAAAVQPAAVTVIVDTLSFSTACTLAVGSGLEVFPFPYAAEAARAFGAALSVPVAGRRREPGYSLSPATYLKPATFPRLVLPSPNGSRLSLRAGGELVVAGCLRNADAVAAFLKQQTGLVRVVSAGELCPDGSLRFALEDYLGAGAILQALGGVMSVEAQVCAAAFAASRERLEECLRMCESGQELREMGFPQDVRLAAELNSSLHVPLLVAVDGLALTYADLPGLILPDTCLAARPVAAYRAAVCG
jgi:2-phosphosulfolactate phosphatase